MSTVPTLDEILEPREAFDLDRALRLISHRVRTHHLAPASPATAVCRDFILLRGRADH